MFRITKINRSPLEVETLFSTIFSNYKSTQCSYVISHIDLTVHAIFNYDGTMITAVDVYYIKDPSYLLPVVKTMEDIFNMVDDETRDKMIFNMDLFR